MLREYASVCLGVTAFLMFAPYANADEQVKPPPAQPPKVIRATDVLSSPEDDIRRYWENTRQMAPKPSQVVIDRLVARAQQRPDDPEALYWAAQLAFDGLSDHVPNPIGMLRRSAEKGFAPAMVMYGVALCEGVHIPRDVTAGMALLNRARDKGEPTAFYHLGGVYFTGVPGVPGVPRNLDRAEDFLKVAVDRGVTRALGVLVRLYGAQRRTTRPVSSSTPRRPPTLATSR